jgi:hypothetical protein
MQAFSAEGAHLCTWKDLAKVPGRIKEVKESGNKGLAFGGGCFAIATTNDAADNGVALIMWRS